MDSHRTKKIIQNLLLIITIATSSAFQPPESSNPVSVRQISPDVFTCDSSNVVVRTICQAALDKFNEELSSAGVSIDSNGLLLTYDNPDDIRIKKGCKRNAEVRHRHVSVRFTRGASLDVQMLSLNEPFLLRVKLPVAVYARVDIKQRFGLKTFLGCSTLGSDSFSFKAQSSTVSNIVIGFTLDPSFGVTKGGDYILKIAPRFTSVFSLDNFKLDFRVSGVNALANVLSFITGLESSLLKTVTALVEGDSVSDTVKEALIFDIGVPIVLGIGSLPGPLEKLIWKKLLLGKIEKRIKKNAQQYSNDFEEKINQKLRKKFRLNSRGERSLLIRNDIVQDLLSGKPAETLFEDVPDDPGIKCRHNFRPPRLCGKHICRQLERFVCPPTNRLCSCSKLSSEWKEKYEPIILAPSLPKISQ